MCINECCSRVTKEKFFLIRRRRRTPLDVVFVWFKEVRCGSCSKMKQPGDALMSLFASRSLDLAHLHRARA